MAQPSVRDANESDLVKGASVFFGPEFVEVHAESGGHTGMLDRESFSAYLPAGVATSEIAPLVQKALMASHSWWPDKFVATGGWRGSSTRWNSWIAELYQRVPMKKNRAALFEGVCWLEIKLRNDVLTLIPKARIRRDEYGYIKSERGVLELMFDINHPQFSWEEALGQGMARCEG